MKLKILTILSIILFTSCKDSDNESSTTKREFQDWIEMTIPNGREAFAVAGDISDTLLVTTWTCAYFTTDSGKNWQLSKDFQGHIYDLVEQSDTIFALLLPEDALKDYIGPPLISNQEFAKTCQYYTTDFGKTWIYDYSDQYENLESPIGIAASPTGITYKLIHDLNMISSNSYTVNFSDIEMYNESQWQKIDFPLNYELNNLHIDKNNHLYVTATSWKYVEETNFEGTHYEFPGLIYYYKNQLP
jgi:hypothetical protein